MLIICKFFLFLNLFVKFCPLLRVTGIHYCVGNLFYIFMVAILNFSERQTIYSKVKFC